MKVDLTYKEANLVTAILWEVAIERAAVNGTFDPLWRLSDKGADIAKRVLDKLDDANEDEVCRTGKDRDLSGAPKGTLQEAKWS